MINQLIYFLAKAILFFAILLVSQPSLVDANEPDVQFSQLEESAISSEVPDYQKTENFSPKYDWGQVIQVLEQQTLPQDPPLYTQQLLVRLSDGHEVEVSAGSDFQPLMQSQLVKTGSFVIIAIEENSEGVQYILADMFRLHVVLAVILGFIVLVVLIARWQGLFSVVGMGLSLIVLLSFTVPRIVEGQNPFVISLVSCIIIAVMTLYIAHGWSWKTHIALSGMLLVLGFVALISQLAVHAAHLVGLGSEEAFFLQYGETGVIDLQGLLLGGILLGALGVLDDITVAQAGIVFQLAGANKNLSGRELFSRAMVIGRDHIASLVNTLFLAYVGANTALFLLFYLNEQTPFWVALNSQQIVEEVIRTMAGSIGLVLAVPLTSLLAAVAVAKFRQKLASEISMADHAHHH